MWRRKNFMFDWLSYLYQINYLIDIKFQQKAGKIQEMRRHCKRNFCLSYFNDFSNDRIVWFCCIQPTFLRNVLCFQPPWFKGQDSGQDPRDVHIIVLHCQLSWISYVLSSAFASVHTRVILNNCSPVLWVPAGYQGVGVTLEGCQAVFIPPGAIWFCCSSQIFSHVPYLDIFFSDSVVVEG